MRKSSIICAALFIAVFSAAGQTQNVSPTAQSAYDTLDVWLRADEFNQRCRVLNYFEEREIGRRTQSALQRTPEGIAAAQAIGQGSFEEKLAKQNELLRTRRNLAKQEVAGRECANNDADIVTARSVYARFFLKLLIAAHNSHDWANERPGRVNANQTLMSFVQSLYGPNYNDVAQQLVVELQNEGYDAAKVWDLLVDPIDDLVWQIRLGEKKFGFYRHPSFQGYYQAEFKETFTPLGAKLGHRSYKDVVLADGKKILVNGTEGVTDDGRIIVLIGKDTRDSAPMDMKASLFVQEESDWQLWNKKEWRAGALRFDGERMEDNDCPVDFCFIFPKTATEAIVKRRGGKTGYTYSYEMVIADPSLYPLKTEESSYNRSKYTPPRLPGEK